MLCLNSNWSQIFKPIVNGQEDIHLLGNFPPHRQLCALGKRQRGRLEHHRTLFYPAAAQQEVVTWRLGLWGEGRLQQGPLGREMSGGLTQNVQSPGRWETGFQQPLVWVFCDIEKTPALDWHKADMAAGHCKSKGCQAQNRGSRETASWARDDSPGRAEVLSAIYANMWGSLFQTEETTESRVIQSYVGCGCVCDAQVQHPPFTKTGLARSGGLRKEESHQNLFFPQALAKIQRHRFAFIRRCGGDHGGFQSWTTKIPFCLFTRSTGCSEKCLCAGLVRGSLNYSRSS